MKKNIFVNLILILILLGITSLVTVKAQQIELPQAGAPLAPVGVAPLLAEPAQPVADTPDERRRQIQLQIDQKELRLGEIQGNRLTFALRLTQIAGQIADLEIARSRITTNIQNQRPPRGPTSQEAMDIAQIDNELAILRGYITQLNGQIAAIDAEKAQLQTEIATLRAMLANIRD